MRACTLASGRVVHACSVSRFYMSGACVNTRSNDFNSAPNCNGQGGSVNDASLASCERVFNSSAPCRLRMRCTTSLAVASMQGLQAWVGRAPMLMMHTGSI